MGPTAGYCDETFGFYNNGGFLGQLNDDRRLKQGSA
jgi:hypothetical protein